MADLLPISGPCPFLSLPLELRTMVYLACTSDCADEGASPTTIPRQRFGFGCIDADYKLRPAYERLRKAKLSMNLYYPLLQTCRQVRIEATPIFDNHGQCISSTSQTRAFLKSIGRLRRARLRRLSFVYHVTLSHGRRFSDLSDGCRLSDKLIEFELAVQCFHLISKGCRNLQELVIYMNEQYVKRYDRIVAWPWSSRRRTRGDNAARQAFDVKNILGILDLCSIQSLKKVKFVPIGDYFNDDFKLALNKLASEIMQAKKDEQAVRGKIRARRSRHEVSKRTKSKICT